MPRLIAVVAATPDRIIGKDGDMPWRLGSDLRRFKRLTLGSPIVMGRKTFESIGRPLPGRRNIVLTRNREWSAEGVETRHDPHDLLRAADDAERIFIVGGGELYRMTWHLCDAIYYTCVEAKIDGDTEMPAIDPAHFALKHQSRVPQTQRDSVPTEFQIWERTAPT